MPKLQRLIDDANNRGANIQIGNVPPKYGAGCFYTDGRRVVLDRGHVDGLVSEFDEDRMIVVLYHELGHHRYMMQVDKGHSFDEVENEFRAFKNSLERCRELARNGDKGPLKAALFWIPERLKRKKADAVYEAAMKQVMSDPLWAQYVADAA